MTASLLPLALTSFADANGNPLAGGSVGFYIPGTLTASQTWADAAQTILNTQPVILDAAGRCIVYGVGSYRTIVKDALGNTIWDAVTTDTLGQVTTLRSDLASLTDASKGSALVGYFRTGQVGRTVEAKFADTLSVLDFGAVGDSVTNDTTAINAAIAAAIAAGRRLYFPKTSGSYLISGVLTVNGGVELFGDFQTTTIITSSATAVIFNVTGWNVSIHDLVLDSSATRTAGAYIDMPALVSNVRIVRVQLNNHQLGIRIASVNSAIVHIQDCYFFGCVATTGVGIYIAGGNDVFIKGCTMNSAASPQPFAAVQVVGAGALVIENCDLIQHNSCMLMNPAAGQVIASVYVTDTFFDTSTSYGLCVLPSSTGAIVRCRFIGCWFSAHGINGVLVSSSGTSSTVTGLEFIDCHMFNNTSDGVRFSYGSNYTMIGCQVAGNTSGAGVHIDAGISGITLVGNTLGPAGGYGVNNYGVFIANGASDHYIVANNQLQGNTTAAFTNGGTGSNTITTPNLLT